MINPLKFRREYLELTQDQLASKAGVTRQVATLAEQGLYIQPPSRLIEVLAGPNPEARQVLIANYLAWVNQKRYENQHLFLRVDLELTKAGKHPWFTLKNQVAGKSNQAFCRALVYQPSLIREYEKFGRGSINIFSALRQVGLEDKEIGILSGAERF